MLTHFERECAAAWTVGAVAWAALFVALAATIAERIGVVDQIWCRVIGLTGGAAVLAAIVAAVLWYWSGILADRVAVRRHRKRRR